MGEGEFDIVRIHRVIRESRPNHPIPTKGDVFMVHGAFTGFDGTFFSVGMESSDINAKTSSPFYLASKNIEKKSCNQRADNFWGLALEQPCFFLLVERKKNTQTTNQSNDILTRKLANQNQLLLCGISCGI